MSDSKIVGDVTRMEDKKGEKGGGKKNKQKQTRSETQHAYIKVFGTLKLRSLVFTKM